MRPTTRLLSITAAAGVVVTLAALPALASGTSASVNGARLLARGAAVSVTVTVTCDPYIDWSGNPQTSTPVTVTINEAVRHGVMTQGSASGTAACDSTPHRVTVLMVPAPLAFTRGSALITVTPTFNSAITPPALVRTVAIR